MAENQSALPSRREGDSMGDGMNEVSGIGVGVGDDEVVG
jgi:hypothetical protein